MKIKVAIGIIGDFDSRPSHIKLNEALYDMASLQKMTITLDWIETPSLLSSQDILNRYDGLICSPGSPYKSQEGAILGIKRARERGCPFLGLCGGFQHTLLEYARHQLFDTIKDEALRTELSEGGEEALLAPLECDLMGKEAAILLDEKSKAATFYGTTDIKEFFRCNYSLKEQWYDLFKNSSLKLVGKDHLGHFCLLEHKDLPYFMAALYQPQFLSSKQNPHPLLLKFLYQAKCS